MPNQVSSTRAKHGDQTTGHSLLCFAYFLKGRRYVMGFGNQIQPKHKIWEIHSQLISQIKSCCWIALTLCCPNKILDTEWNDHLEGDLRTLLSFLIWQSRIMLQLKCTMCPSSHEDSHSFLNRSNNNNTTSSEFLSCQIYWTFLITAFSCSFVCKSSKLAALGA